MADDSGAGGEAGQAKHPDGKPPDPRERLEALRKGSAAGSIGAAGKYAGLGFQFAVSVLLFLYLGQWADRKLGTEPLFLFVGVFTGAGAAFYAMYRMLMADQRREEAEKAEKAGKAGQAEKPEQKAKQEGRQE